MKQFTLTVAATIFAFSVQAGELPDSEHIRVHTARSIRVPPDMATFRLTISQSDASAAKAKADVDARSAKVIDTARSLGVTKEDITASELDISPHYTYEGEKEVVAGTYVKRTIKIVLNDLGKYSNLVQKLAEIPITSLDGITMSAKKMDDHRDKALANAIAGAKSKAVTIAKQFDAEVGKVYSISHTRGRYSFGSMAAGSSLDATGIPASRFEPGTIEVHADITVVFRLKQKE